MICGLIELKLSISCWDSLWNLKQTKFNKYRNILMHSPEPYYSNLPHNNASLPTIKRGVPSPFVGEPINWSCSPYSLIHTRYFSLNQCLASQVQRCRLVDVPITIWFGDMGTLGGKEGYPLDPTARMWSKERDVHSIIFMGIQ